MLVRMFGAVAATAVAPLIDLTDLTPAFWNQPPVKALLWRITFPDGATFSFNATVLAERVLDGEVELTLRPIGEMMPCACSKDTAHLTEYARSAATKLIMSNGKTVELQEIKMPEVSRGIEDGHVVGLLRRSDLEIRVSGYWEEA